MPAKTAEPKAAKAPKEPKAPKAEKVNSAIAMPEKKVTHTSTFKGFLTAFGLVTIPVAAYKAADADKIEKNMYHSAECMSRLKYAAMKCTGCNEEVPKGEEVYGVTVDGITFLVTDDEMKAQQALKDGVLLVTEYVPTESIDPIYYDCTEYLCCGDIAPQIQAVYANFRDGLMLSGRVAIGRIVNRGNEYYVAIRPRGNGLVMSYLYSEYEIRTCDKVVTVPSNPDDSQTFASLMSDSDHGAKDTFSPAPYNSYLKNVRAMIAKKAAGGKSEPQKQAESPAPVADMMAALKASLKQSKAAKAGK
jgi:DNA end-binding protein Ku